MRVISRLKELSSELYDLQNVLALLGWDQEVYMPPGAVTDRANQLALLSRLVHERQTAAELGELLQQSFGEVSSYSVEDAALVRVMRRLYDQATRLPVSFVTGFSKLTSESVHAWIEARSQSKFSLFAPYLEKIVEMTKQQAELLGYEKHPYDALLDLYEEGLTTGDIEVAFQEIKSPLVELLPLVQEKWSIPLGPHEPIGIEDQKAFLAKLVTEIGYDFARGRMDVAPHPFMTRLGHSDRRITNRYDIKDIGGALFGSMHEAGHAMYEQGISDKLAYTDLDNGVSLGMHESQSRMWENMIGRSLPFWEGYFPRLQAAFPSQFGSFTVEEFYRKINRVKSSLIRTESDEVTYNLHILIRFEIEKALLEGAVLVKDVREMWDAKYKEYLGVEVPDDAHGILQDIHWAHGTLGYFPTYMLGNLAAAQIWNGYQQYDSDFEGTLRSGNFTKIRTWLSENMYQYGSVYMPKELMQCITGEELRSKYLIEYLKKKYL